MFRTDSQLAHVCETLCRKVGLGGCWTKDGPTDKACKWLKRAPGWSHGELLMFQFAWCLWNGSKKPDLYAMIGTLDGSNMRAIGTLFVAMGDMRGSIAIDEWLSMWELVGGRRPTSDELRASAKAAAEDAALHIVKNE